MPMHKIYIIKIEPLLEDSLYEKALSMIGKDRRESVIRMKNRPDQARSVAAGLLLNYAVIHHCGCPWDGSFRLGEHGKPMLPDRYGLFFNLSHSGDYAVCALADREIGVDIQKHKEYKETLARRFFHPEELAFLSTAGDQKRCFYDLWSMKESCVKYTGQGLSTGMDSFSVIPLLHGENMHIAGQICIGEWNPPYQLLDIQNCLDQLTDQTPRIRNGEEDFSENALRKDPIEGYSLSYVTTG